MPKQTDTKAPNTQLNQLANQIKFEQAEYQFRLANYFSPYGFNPEQVDHARAGKLIEDYGDTLATTVFAQSSANLQERVTYVVNEWQDRQAGLEALFTAGAEISATDEDLYAHAFQRVFNMTRAGQQAAQAKVA